MFIPYFSFFIIFFLLTSKLYTYTISYLLVLLKYNKHSIFFNVNLYILHFHTLYLSLLYQ